MVGRTEDAVVEVNVEPGCHLLGDLPLHPAGQVDQRLLEGLGIGLVAAADGQPDRELLDRRPEAVHLAEVFH